MDENEINENEITDNLFYKLVMFKNGVPLGVFFGWLVTLIGAIYIVYIDGDVYRCYGWYIANYSFLLLAISESKNTYLKNINLVNNIFIVQIEKYLLNRMGKEKYVNLLDNMLRDNNIWTTEEQGD